MEEFVSARLESLGLDGAVYGTYLLSILSDATEAESAGGEDERSTLLEEIVTEAGVADREQARAAVREIVECFDNPSLIPASAVVDEPQDRAAPCEGHDEPAAPCGGGESETGGVGQHTIWGDAGEGHFGVEVEQPDWAATSLEPGLPGEAGYGGGYDNGSGGGYGGYDAGGPGWPGDAGTPGWPSWSQEHGVWAPDQGVACGKGAGFGGWPGEGELETEREVECFVLWVGRSAPPRPRGVPPSGHTLHTKPEMGARGGASVAPWRDRPLVPLPSLFTPKPLSPGNPKPWKPGLMFRA
jgi:hypothetical protein